MCGPISVKFQEMALEALDWCAMNVCGEAHKTAVTQSKRAAITDFEQKHTATRNLLARYVARNTGKKARPRGHKSDNFMESLSKDDLEVLVFAFREYLYHLDYEERKFNIRDGRDLDSEERVGLSQDAMYLHACLRHCEELLVGDSGQ